MLTPEDIKNYVVHHWNLQFYLKQGIRLKKVHRGEGVRTKTFDGAIRPYEHVNIKRKQKAISRETFTGWWTTVFGKTMENLRNHADVKFARIWVIDTIRRLVASPLKITRKVYTSCTKAIDSWTSLFHSHDNSCYYTLRSLSLFWLDESVQWISKSAPVTS